MKRGRPRQPKAVKRARQAAVKRSAAEREWTAVRRQLESVALRRPSDWAKLGVQGPKLSHYADWAGLVLRVGQITRERFNRIIGLIYVRALEERDQAAQDRAALVYREVAEAAVQSKRAKAPRPTARVLGDGVIKDVAESLINAGIHPRRLEGEVRKALELKGIRVPSKPTLRNHLSRLGFRKKKES